MKTKMNVVYKEMSVAKCYHKCTDPKNATFVISFCALNNNDSEFIKLTSLLGKTVTLTIEYDES